MKERVDEIFEKYSRHPEKKYLDVKELNYVLLYLYDDLNMKLPFHMNLPTPCEVDELAERHQVGGKETELIDRFKMKKIVEEAFRLRAADSLLMRTVKVGLMEMVIKPVAFSFLKAKVTELGIPTPAPATVLLTAFNQVGKYLYAVKTILSMS